MYSVVLMLAVTGGGDAPAAHWGRGCYGCNGGHYSSCYGGCYGGYYGSSCYGSSCHGGSYSCHGGHGFFGKHRRGHSCHGGYSCNGGYSCHGGYSCNGGYYSGCYGGCYGGTVVPVTPAEPIKTEPKPNGSKPEEKKIEDKPTGESTAANLAPATLIVNLPAQAVLTVDGAPTRTTSSERTFITPNLDVSREYFYRLQATWEQDGKQVVVTKRVAVRPGQQVRVTIDGADAASVASR